MTVGASGPEACDDASGALPGGWRDRGSVRRHVRGATTTRDVGNADDAPHLRQPDHGRRLVGSWPDPRRRRLLLGALHVRMAARAAGRAQPRPGQLAVHRPRIHLASQAASRRYAPRHLGQRDGLESQHETVPDLRAVARWRELRLLRRSSRRPLQGEEPRPEHGHRSGILRRRGWAALLAHESCPPPRTGTRRPRDQARRDADRSVAVQALRRARHLQARRLLLPAVLGWRHAATRAEHDQHAAREGTRRAVGSGSGQPGDVLDRQGREVRGPGARHADRHAGRRVVHRLPRARDGVLHAGPAVPARAHHVDGRRMVASRGRQGARNVGEGARAGGGSTPPPAV